MKRYQIVILPAILLLLAGCARSAVLSSPSVQVPEETETSSPSHTAPPAASDQVAVKKDRLPEGISEDFMAFIKSTYGTSVYDLSLIHI